MLEEVQDSELLEAASAFDEDSENGTDGWELLWESDDRWSAARGGDNVRICRKKQMKMVAGGEKQMYMYRVKGTYQKHSVQKYFNTLMDMAYYKVWDQNMQTNALVGMSPSGDSESWYWQVKYPYPLSNRDYVFKQRGALLLPHDAASDTTDAGTFIDFLCLPEFSRVRASTFSKPTRCYCRESGGHTCRPVLSRL